MGLLRLFLALSVVVFHSYPVFGYQLIAPDVAVHSFFVISGFYMAFILREKYTGKNGSYKLFLTSRILRIFPLYWIVVFLLFSLALVEFIVFPTQDNALSIILQTAVESSNYYWTLFMTFLRNVTLIATTDYFQTNFHSKGYLILLVAWTLQIELLFYLIAPFVTKFKTSLLVALTLIFGWITFGYQSSIPQEDGSITFIMISKFVYFLLGILSYTLYRRLHKTVYMKTLATKVILLFALAILIFGFYSTIEKLPVALTILYYVLLTASIPFIFYFSKKSIFDKSLANLSYPVYLSHVLVFKVITNSPLQILPQTAITLLTIAATLVFSYVLVKTVELPIDRQRKKMLE